MEKVISMLETTKDEKTLLDTIYDLYFYIGICQGLEDVNNNNVITLKEFDEEMEALYESYTNQSG